MPNTTRNAAPLGKLPDSELLKLEQSAANFSQYMQSFNPKPNTNHEKYNRENHNGGLRISR